MADNSTQQGNDSISTDDLTTLNGGAVSGQKVQRMKVGFGADGVLRDVDANNGLPIAGSQSALVTAAWTSATALNTALAVPITGYNTITVGMSNTSTMTAGVLTFEVSPDSTNGTNGTWFPISMARIDSYTNELTYTLNTVANRAWSTSVDGWVYFRVRLSTVITGTGTASLFATAQTMPIEPIVTVGQAVASQLNATVVASGNVAHDGVDSGNPVKVGGQARTTDRTAVASGDRTDFVTDLLGNQATIPYGIPDLSVDGTGTATASTADVSLIAAPGAGVRLYITTIIISNSSAIDTEVVIKDGTTAKLTIPAPQKAGAIINLPKPLRLTANAALQFASLASVTSMKVSVVGYKAGA